MKPHVLFCANADSACYEVVAPIFTEFGIDSDLNQIEHLQNKLTLDYSAIVVSLTWLSSQPDYTYLLQRVLNSGLPTLLLDISAPLERLAKHSVLENVSTTACSSSSISWADIPFCKSLRGLTEYLDIEACVFSNTDSSWEDLVFSDNGAILIRSTKEHCSHLFLLAGVPFKCLSSVTDETQALHALFSISPILLFIHNFLSEAIWSTKEILGCFVLDDPPLREEYGFYDIKRLAATIHNNGSASLALIPWYHSKAEMNPAQIVIDQYPKLSLCVHGCDHIWNEFVAVDKKSALSLIGESLKRMDSLKSSFEIDYDPVIVFPQGRFSQNTLKALAESPFLSAINTTLFSFGDNDRISLRELVSPVHVRNGFPVFQRYYPDEIVKIAFAVLMGKAIIYGEHHTFFRNGYSALENLFSNTLIDSWTSPAIIAKTFCQTRVGTAGTIHVRFFSPDFQYTPCKCPISILFQTKILSESIESVLVNGTRVPHTIEDDAIHFCVKAIDTKILHIIIKGNASTEYPKYRKTTKESLRIMLRRKMSEFRDNVISKSPLAEAAYDTVRNLFK